MGIKVYKEEEMRSWCTDCGWSWIGYPRYCGQCASIFIECEPIKEQSRSDEGK